MDQMGLTAVTLALCLAHVVPVRAADRHRPQRREPATRHAAYRLPSADELGSSATIAVDPRPNSLISPGLWMMPPTPADYVASDPSFYVMPEPWVLEHVFRRYGLDPRSSLRHRYVVLWVVPPALDGTPDASNLWPIDNERYSIEVWKLQELHRRTIDRVRSGKMTLADAQARLSSDWLDAYDEIVMNMPPKARGNTAVATVAFPQPLQVSDRH